MSSTVYLIPSLLAEDRAEVIPAYVLDAVKQCNVFFVENERTARRYLKLLWREMVIDDYEWFNMKEVTELTAQQFHQKIREGKTIGLISEAGCPGVADPGQQLVLLAQQAKIPVKPLVGPNSILLALMGSGMNGQHFQFTGYLPIEPGQRLQSLKALESESRQKGCTQIFIETPYRNNQLLETIIRACQPQTKICIAVDLTAATESIITKTVKEWKAAPPQLHKRPAIFLMLAS